MIVFGGDDGELRGAWSDGRILDATPGCFTLSFRELPGAPSTPQLFQTAKGGLNEHRATNRGH